MTTFNGKNYSIEAIENQFVLVHPVSENETFDSFDELVESHPICEEARKFFFPRTPISISKDGVWAGNGILENGCIVDCAADLATDAESCEQAYEMIEDAIADGQNMVIAGSEGQVNFSWRIGN